MAQQFVTVGPRRVAAEFASNLQNVLPGDFEVMEEYLKETDQGADQAWLKISLSDGQILMVASGDLLDMHLKGAKIYDGEPVVGQQCPLREGLLIGVKNKKLVFA